MRTAYSLALAALILSLGSTSEPVKISLAVGGKSYKVSGNGSCHFAPMASYRDMRARMWQIEFSAEGKTGLTNLTLTAWHPLSGGADQMSLYVGIGSVRHRIDTVKGSDNVGSGTLKLKPSGDGGTFVINGKDDKGASIKGTVECMSFSSPPAEAG
jgi:hypothetical protein